MTTTSAPDTEAPDEGVGITPTGLVQIQLDGQLFVLRRPKIGQMRALEESLVAIATDEIERKATLAKDIAEAAGQDAESRPDEALSDEQAAAVAETVVEHESDQRTTQGQLFDWWRECVRVLEKGGQKLPDSDDEMPPWLANWDLLAEVRRAWRSLPWLPGGQPRR